jgi:hypothetical protein
LIISTRYATLSYSFRPVRILCNNFVHQVNDDTQIVTPNWAPAFISALENNPYAPNVGVTGPSDTHNRQIFTHSFVHRTHFEVCIAFCQDCTKFA